jgi:hypothetical protein
MENTPEGNNPTKAVLEQLLAGVSTLELALKEAETRSQKYVHETESLQAQCDDLRRQVNKMERDYAALRIQKGGFGIRTLTLVAMGAMLCGVLCAWVYVKLRPKPDHVVLFNEYRRTHLFSYEVMLSRGEYEQVLMQLDQDALKPAYAPIREEIAFARKLLAAAGKN